MKRQKDGESKCVSKRAQEIKQEAEKMVKLWELPPGSLDRHAAWKTYGKTIERAMEEGQIWRPDIIRKLYPIALQLLDESELICLTADYEEAKDEARRRKRKLRRAARKLAK